MTPCPQVVEHWPKLPSWHENWKQQGSAGHGAKLGLLAALVMAGQPLPHRALSTVLPRLFLQVHCVARVSVRWPHVCVPHAPMVAHEHAYVMHTGAVHGSVAVGQPGTVTVVVRGEGTASGGCWTASAGCCCTMGWPGRVMTCGGAGAGGGGRTTGAATRLAKSNVAPAKLLKPRTDCEIGLGVTTTATNCCVGAGVAGTSWVNG
jgi:hypothetical protein